MSEQYQKACPHCGADLSKTLFSLAHESGYGYPESVEFLCGDCEGELSVTFSWDVVFAELSNIAKAGDSEA